MFHFSIKRKLARRRVDVGLLSMLALIAVPFTLVFGAIAAWMTHVIVCIQTANYLFLLTGAIAAPVGVIHGVGVWLGAW